MNAPVNFNVTINWTDVGAAIEVTKRERPAPFCQIRCGLQAWVLIQARGGRGGHLHPRSQRV